MGVTASLLAAGTVVQAGSQIMQGFQAKSTAEQNARIYDAQAQNIAAQQGITADQFRTKGAQIAGSATAAAGRGGVKFSGSVASSVSQSMYQLGLDQSYAQYNLQVQKNQAQQAAALQRYQGGAALRSGFINAGVTALGGGYNLSSKYGDKIVTAFRGVPTGYTPSIGGL